MSVRSDLSERELKAIAYFVVGVGSEGSLRGHDVSARLSFAGKYMDGKMIPVGQSGLSIGTLQKDLGQDGKETAKALVSAYQSWARMNQADKVLSSDEEVCAIKDLSRNGRQLREDGGRAIDSNLKERLDSFLRSEDGRKFVHARDVAQVEHIYTHALAKLKVTPAYVQASIDDKIQLATIVAKGFNQSEKSAKQMLGHMSDAKGPAKLSSADEVRAYTNDKFNKVMKDGQGDALRASAVYARLHAMPSDHPLHDAWHEVLRDPLALPASIDSDTARSNFAPHYRAVKNLFLEPANAKSFLDALEEGRDFARGAPQTPPNMRAASGYFSSGSDFVQWNADGHGVAYLNGSWSEISRDQLTRIDNPDRSVVLSFNGNDALGALMHVRPDGHAHGMDAEHSTLKPGMRGKQVEQLQEQLAELGFTDARGRPLHADGHFGPATHAAIQGFQREHDLVSDGIAGPATLKAVREEVIDARRSVDPGEIAYLREGRATVEQSHYDSLARATVESFNVPYASSEPTAQRVSPAFQLHPSAPLQSVPNVEDRTNDSAYPSHRESEGFGDLRLRSREVRATGDNELTSGPKFDANDPRHADNPQHELYEELSRCIPQASEERLLQFTAVCHENLITAGNLSEIRLDDKASTITFIGTGPLTSPAQINLDAEPPRPEQAVAQIQQHDQREAQVMAEVQSQQAQLSAGHSL